MISISLEEPENKGEKLRYMKLEVKQPKIKINSLNFQHMKKPVQARSANMKCYNNNIVINIDTKVYHLRIRRRGGGLKEWGMA